VDPNVAGSNPVDRPFFPTHIMSLYQAIFLGLVQGLTEFFPISSSAHLKIAKWFLGLPLGEELVFFDLALHTGTLLALIIYLRKEIFEVLSSFRQIAYFFLALIPLVPAYFLLKPLRIAASDPKYLGFALMITAALLFAATRKQEETQETKWSDVFWIGLSQSFALIPGISRSGSTIAVARFRGWNWQRGAKFSFLLAIPTVLGGELLESLKGISTGGVPFKCYVGGFFASFALGLITVRFVFWIYERKIVRPIAWYCLSIGLFAWVIFSG
jgi:undecaprenyl-diphosphatase